MTAATTSTPESKDERLDRERRERAKLAQGDAETLRAIESSKRKAHATTLGWAASRIARALEVLKLDPPKEPAPDEANDDNVVPIASARRRKGAPKPTGAPRRELEQWEEALLAKLLVNLKEDPETGEEKPVSIRQTPANVATILLHHPKWAGVVALNVFHLRIETTRSPAWHTLDAPKEPKAGAWTDADTARLVHWFARTWICGLPPMHVGAKTIEAALLVAAEANTFHPVRDYLRGLQWDGEKRIDTWVANYLGGELTPYACAVGAAFPIGAVARVMRPGCKLDTMIVIEGPQGAKKSTALETMFSPWYADSRLPIGEKDALQMLAGVWGWELAELAAMKKPDVETIKAFLSNRSDRYRPSYGKHTIDVLRQIVFAGSTNAGTYLHDETGGRRFLPLKTGRIDIDALRRDRDQLWAEALHRFDAGEKWWLDDALTAPEQTARFVEDEWQSRIETYLQLRTSTTVGEVLDDLIFRDVDKDGNARNTLGKWGQREQNRVARCLARMGWVRRQVRVKGDDVAREWRYLSPRHHSVTSDDDEVVT